MAFQGQIINSLFRVLNERTRFIENIKRQRVPLHSH